MAAPTYLTGDRAGIAEFIDKFEVRYLPLGKTVAVER